MILQYHARHIACLYIATVIERLISEYTYEYGEVKNSPGEPDTNLRPIRMKLIRPRQHDANVYPEPEHFFLLAPVENTHVTSVHRLQQLRFTTHHRTRINSNTSRRNHARGSHVALRSRMLGEEVVHVGVAELFISPPCRTTHKAATILSTVCLSKNTAAAVVLNWVHMVPFLRPTSPSRWQNW